MVQPLKNWSDLKNRTVSSIALAALSLFCVWMGGVFFIALIICAAVLMLKEWKELTVAQDNSIQLLGYPCVILPCSCILWLRDISIASDPSLGFKIVFTLIAVISATDIGAYFTGRQIGKNKLSPSISPNKTWEGLGGGVVAATIAGLVFSSFIHIPNVLAISIVVSPLIAVIAQIGDLFKSWIKRKAGVKDSGTLLPGHGGLLDRFDSYLFATPVLSVIVYFALRAVLQ